MDIEGLDSYTRGLPLFVCQYSYSNAIAKVCLLLSHVIAFIPSHTLLLPTRTITLVTSFIGLASPILYSSGGVPFFVCIAH